MRATPRRRGTLAAASFMASFVRAFSRAIESLFLVVPAPWMAQCILRSLLPPTKPRSTTRRVNATEGRLEKRGLLEGNSKGSGDLGGGTGAGAACYLSWNEPPEVSVQRLHATENWEVFLEQRLKSRFARLGVQNHGDGSDDGSHVRF